MPSVKTDFRSLVRKTLGDPPHAEALATAVVADLAEAGGLARSGAEPAVNAPGLRRRAARETLAAWLGRLIRFWFHPRRTYADHEERRQRRAAAHWERSRVRHDPRWRSF